MPRASSEALRARRRFLLGRGRVETRGSRKRKGCLHRRQRFFRGKDQRFVEGEDRTQATLLPESRRLCRR